MQTSWRGGANLLAPYNPDAGALVEALRGLAVEGALLAGGNGTDAASRGQLAAAAGIAGRFDYVGRAGHYDSNAAFGIVDYLRHRPAPLLLHVDRSPHGEWSLLAVHCGTR